MKNRNNNQNDHPYKINPAPPSSPERVPVSILAGTLVRNSVGSPRTQACRSSHTDTLSAASMLVYVHPAVRSKNGRAHSAVLPPAEPGRARSLRTSMPVSPCPPACRSLPACAMCQMPATVLQVADTGFRADDDTMIAPPGVCRTSATHVSGAMVFRS